MRFQEINMRVFAGRQTGNTLQRGRGGARAGKPERRKLRQEPWQSKCVFARIIIQRFVWICSFWVCCLAWDNVVVSMSVLILVFGGPRDSDCVRVRIHL